MTWHCLNFEATGIQSWILGSGRLRPIVGGSRIVSGLTGELLEAVLDALPGEGKQRIVFARRAGGAFQAFSEDAGALEALHRVWPLMIARYAPGLGFHMGWGSAESVRQAGIRARADSSGAGAMPRAELPAATPFMERCRRTGRAAVSVGRHESDPVDAITRAQERAESVDKWGREGDDDIAARLAAELDRSPEAWPRDMEPRHRERENGFPFPVDERGEVTSRYVALVHIDGNGLGQILHRLETIDDDGAARIARFRDFSDRLEQATREACLHACRATLLNDPADGTPFERLPARPIVLGGDDLTFIVRADLALHFAREFMTAFEAGTRQQLGDVPGLAEEDGLTACAGLAFLRSNQPFHMAAALAESLCDHAKKQVRQATAGYWCEETGEDVPAEPMFSALCLHRCTDSLLPDWESLLHNSLTLGPADDDTGDETFRLNVEAWALHADNAGAFPAVEALLDLVGFFEHPAVARGPARRLVGLLGTHPDLVAEKYRRWREMLDKTPAPGVSCAIFDDLLKVGLEFGRDSVHPSAPFLWWDSHWTSPLPEALALKAMGVPVRLEPVAEAQSSPEKAS